MIYLSEKSGNSLSSVPSRCLEVKQTRKMISVKGLEHLGGSDPGLGKGTLRVQCHLCRLKAFLLHVSVG